MRKEFLNRETGEIYTELMLELMGAPKNLELLALVNIFPLEHPECPVDMWMEEPRLVEECTFEDGKYIQPYYARPLPEDVQARNLERFAKKRADEARVAADDATAPLLADFSETEKLTFPQQRLEVEAWLKDNAVATPTLDALAQQRGIERQTQIDKAVVKVQLFDAMAALIVGQQQKYEDEIKAVVAKEATPRERYDELKTMRFTYSLPEA